MKRNKGFLTLCFFIATVFSGCKKNDPPLIVVDNGSWKVSYFSKDGNEQTAHFSGYTFRFEKSGKALATGSSTTIGSWSSENDDGRLKFNISFTPPPMNELNEDWTVTGQEPKAMQLQHTSGGGGGTEYLTFQKQ
jgi:hypothetical protein